MDIYFNGLTSEVPSSNSLENTQLPGDDRQQYTMLFQFGFHAAHINPEKAMAVVEVLCANHPLKDAAIEGVQTKLDLLEEKKCEQK